VVIGVLTIAAAMAAVLAFLTVHPSDPHKAEIRASARVLELPTISRGDTP
jgi:hypothetical protein